MKIGIYEVPPWNCDEPLKNTATDMVFVKAGLTEVIHHLEFYWAFVLKSTVEFQLPCLHKYHNR